VIWIASKLETEPYPDYGKLSVRNALLGSIGFILLLGGWGGLMMLIFAAMFAN
jgi:hypothetical protein